MKLLSCAVAVLLDLGRGYLKSYFSSKWKKEGLLKAVSEAKKRNKPLLIVGEYTKLMPNVVKMTLPEVIGLRFADKEFGSSAVMDASSITDDELQELMRISDTVVLIYPYFWAIKQHKERRKIKYKNIGPGGWKEIYCS